MDFGARPAQVESLAVVPARRSGIHRFPGQLLLHARLGRAVHRRAMGPARRGQDVCGERSGEDQGHHDGRSHRRGCRGADRLSTPEVWQGAHRSDGAFVRDAARREAGAAPSRLVLRLCRHGTVHRRDAERSAGIRRDAGRRKGRQERQSGVGLVSHRAVSRPGAPGAEPAESRHGALLAGDLWRLLLAFGIRPQRRNCEIES